MSQRRKTLTQVLGYFGWKVVEAWFEKEGQRVGPVADCAAEQGLLFVVQVERGWAPHCAMCGARRARKHEQRETRRWHDLPWAGRTTVIQYAPIRVECRRCHGRGVEMLAWADPYQRQTRRFQQYLAIDAASMPVSHVAARHGLDWETVRRAEECAIERWEGTQEQAPLRHVGLDEKWLGRRHQLDYEYVTIVSNNETGEPLWIGPGRREATLEKWLATQTKEQKSVIQLFVMDMHQPFWNAVSNDRDLDHAAIVHDPFHVMKRAAQAIDELRREAFFRAGPELRAIGRGKRWLVLRPWAKTTEAQKQSLRLIFRLNRKLARGYQIVEELRAALHAPDRASMEVGLSRVVRRTQRMDNKPLRGLHDSLLAHWNDILALGEHRPATGRVEALNNNWETLVRVSRGVRNYEWLRRKLRFMIANPIRTVRGLKRFQALGLPAPIRSPTQLAA
jgi:transposase